MKVSKLQKFEEIAERRVNEALHKIKLIGNLSNTGNYEYTDQHVKQIISALKGALKETESRFTNKGKSEGNGFRFK